MNQYEVKFSIYGKRLKVTIKAESKQHAKRIIKQDIVFHSVAEIEPVSDPEFLGNKRMFDQLMDIFHSKP